MTMTPLAELVLIDLPDEVDVPTDLDPPDEVDVGHEGHGQLALVAEAGVHILLLYSTCKKKFLLEELDTRAGQWAYESSLATLRQ